MSIHTGISLFLLLSSIVFTGITNDFTELVLLFVSLYGFNIYQDKVKSLDSEKEIREAFNNDLKKLNDKIDNNRDNNAVIVKEMKQEISDAASKMNEIRLSASTPKTQQANNATKYRF